jgi:hypothetical protein
MYVFMYACMYAHMNACMYEIHTQSTTIYGNTCNEESSLKTSEKGVCMLRCGMRTGGGAGGGGGARGGGSGLGAGASFFTAHARKPQI